MARPELAAVPAATQGTLAQLASEYLLVACVSGRSGPDAKRLVGVGGIRYVGNHGLELHPDAAAASEDVRAFGRTIDERWLVEDKGLSLSVHFRDASDEADARAALELVADRAAAAGLRPRWGRKVLEIRPPLQADKGTAVTTLLSSAGARHAMYAGDDTTDIDAFRAIRKAGLETAVAIALDSAEAPPELLAEADIVVSNPAEFASDLAWLSSRSIATPPGAAPPTLG